MRAVRDYLAEVQEKYQTGIAREHAYRPALQTLLESAGEGINAVNDAARSEIGMPDFVVMSAEGNTPIGIVEAKDIGDQLNRTERSAQMRRYMAHGNVILTDYLEFRWYVNGEERETVRIAKASQGKIERIPKAYADLTKMLRRFASEAGPSINSARELARRLAGIAQEIAYYIEKDLDSQDPDKNLLEQKGAFEETLLPNLSHGEFADMYAQTFAYGLFAARVNHRGDPAIFDLRGAAADIPQTNPFLRQLFHHSSFGLGRRLDWMMQSLVNVLRRADMDDILADFGRRTQQTDPVVHFYETFLGAYSPALREQRGVYYTPEPVVKYIVRGVDHILKSQFQRPRGLADEKTLILDPAVGTGTFLYFVIERIKEAFVSQRGLWKSYVQRHLLTRLFGFELLMAPYTVAHMNLSLQLKEADYEFKEGERLGIYLTNSLEGATKEKYSAPFAAFIEEEANKAAEIKRDKPIMVVLGNPPYSGHSANRSEIVIEDTDPRSRRRSQTTSGEAGASAPGKRGKNIKRKRIVKTFIGNLLQDYYQVDGEKLAERNTKWLQDDYVKFIRFGQWRIEKTGCGVLAFITNHGYLDNVTFRGMRQSLLKTFTDIYIVNLHGNATKREVTPEGNVDENVFDIQTGVAISLFVKDSEKDVELADVKYIDIWGRRKDKNLWLNQNDLDTSAWIDIECRSPDYLFIPQDAAKKAEYDECFAIKDITLENGPGLLTARDRLTIRDTADSVWDTVTKFSSLDAEEAREHYSLGKDVRDWKVHLAQADIKDSGPAKNHIVKLMYRPFDRRFTYYTGKTKGFICMPRRKIMSHFLSGDNIGLVIGRAGQAADFTAWNVIYCTDSLLDLNIFRRGGGALFPLYLYQNPQNDVPNLRKKQPRMVDAEEADYFEFNEQGRRPNLSQAFVRQMEAKLGLPFITEGGAFVDDDAPQCFGPEDVFYYAYAVFHSPTYRQRYAEFLKIDFPRLPLTSDVGLFGALVKFGAELVSLHLMKSPRLSEYMTTYDVDDDDVIARGYPQYNEKKERVYLNKKQYFGGVPPAVWEFHIGGYQALHKWLKDRRGRQLSYDDLNHVQRMVVALAETVRIMAAIDAAIPQFPID